MENTVPELYLTQFNDICTSLHERKFKRAEKILLEITEAILNHNPDLYFNASDAVMIINILYLDFNHYYKAWLTEKGVDVRNECNALSSIEHDNLLIAQCKDPAAVDDLLYELNNYLISTGKKYFKQEATYHLDCYKRELGSAVL
jgi:hypothetical protein